MITMEKWFRIALLLCSIGFLLEFRPDESFGVEYLTSPWKNLTSEQVTQAIYPVWTYSTVPLTIVAFLMTDYLLYKPVIIIECLSYIIYYSLYIFSYTVPALQAAEFFYAAGSASDIAYCAYFFVQVPKEKFLLVSAYTEAAWLTGYGTAQILGQVLISTGLCNYLQLNYISYSCVITAFFISFFIPNATESIYFHRNTANIPSIVQSQITKNGDEDSPNHLDDVQVAAKFSNNGNDQQLIIKQNEANSPWRLLWTDFTYSFSTGYILKWSIWVAWSWCFSDIIFSYIQAIWKVIDTEEVILNGAIDAAQTILSALAVLVLGYTPAVDWVTYGNLSIAFVALSQSILFLLMAGTNNIWVCYIAYVLFNILTNLSIVVGRAEVCKGLKEESYGLVYGIILFFALIIETIFTIVVVDDIGLGLGPRGQYAFYSGSFAVIGIFFLGLTAYKSGKRSTN